MEKRSIYVLPICFFLSFNMGVLINKLIQYGCDFYKKQRIEQGYTPAATITTIDNGH